MGVVNNEHRITKLEEDGGGGGGLVTRIEVLEEDLEHLEDEYTNLVSYKEEETEIGEWVDGSSIYRKVINIESLPNAGGVEYSIGNIENLKTIVKLSSVFTNKANGNQINTLDGCVMFYSSDGKLTISTSTFDRRTISALIQVEYTKNEE